MRLLQTWLRSVVAEILLLDTRADQLPDGNRPLPHLGPASHLEIAFQLVEEVLQLVIFVIFDCCSLQSLLLQYPFGFGKPEIEWRYSAFLDLLLVLATNHLFFPLKSLHVVVKIFPVSSVVALHFWRLW